MNHGEKLASDIKLSLDNCIRRRKLVGRQGSLKTRTGNIVDENQEMVDIFLYQYFKQRKRMAYIPSRLTSSLGRTFVNLSKIIVLKKIVKLFPNQTIPGF